MTHFSTHRNLMWSPVQKMMLTALLTLLIITTPPPGAAADADRSLDGLKSRLVRDGFDPGYIKSLYGSPGVGFALKGVSLFFVHSESRLNYDQFLSDKSISKARKYLKTHQASLQSAHELYGVDPAVITAIILVETRLGTYLGNRRVVNTLSTMSALDRPDNKEALWKALPKDRRYGREKYDRKVKQKSRWAYKELTSLLEFARRENLDASTIKGSYAGAMGICQFMPSNALTLARDGNGDGKINLFDHSDAIHSVAHYLKRHGWRTGQSREKAHKVLYAYNHSNYYVKTLLGVSDRLRSDASF